MNKQKQKELLEAVFEIGLRGVQTYNGDGSLIDHMINTTIDSIPNQIIINTDPIKKNIKYHYDKESVDNVPPPPILENTFYVSKSTKRQVVFFYKEKDWLKNIDQEDMEYLRQKGLR